jgi:hypothetical protein
MELVKPECMQHAAGGVLSQEQGPVADGLDRRLRMCARAPQTSDRGLVEKRGSPTVPAQRWLAGSRIFGGIRSVFFARSWRYSDFIPEDLAIGVQRAISA